MIRAIMACDDAGGISNVGTLPWSRNSKDLKWFKENTKGHVVVMGSTTWCDPMMPHPLPLRTNVLVTNNKESYPGCDEYISGNLLDELPKLAQRHAGRFIWVIGGAKVLEQSLGVIDELYLSKIPGCFECDTFLPIRKIDTLFNVEWEEIHDDVTFQILKKRK
jgi:dihydrofolate reductase